MTVESAFVVNNFSSRCMHNKYILDESLKKVTCGICSKELSPVWVLMQYRNHENRLRMSINALEKVKDRADKKNKCKCEHCGKMTKIER